MISDIQIGSSLYSLQIVNEKIQFVEAMVYGIRVQKDLTMGDLDYWFDLVDTRNTDDNDVLLKYTGIQASKIEVADEYDIPLEEIEWFATIEGLIEVRMEMFKAERKKYVP